MTLTRNDPEDVKASAHLQNEREMLVETKRVNIVNSYIYVYQPLTSFLPSYSDKNLLSPLNFVSLHRQSKEQPIVPKTGHL